MRLVLLLLFSFIVCNHIFASDGTRVPSEGDIEKKMLVFITPPDSEGKGSFYLHFIEKDYETESDPEEQKTSETEEEDFSSEDDGMGDAPYSHRTFMDDECIIS